jgi:flagellar protein FlaG
MDKLGTGIGLAARADAGGGAPARARVAAPLTGEPQSTPASAAPAARPAPQASQASSKAAAQETRQQLQSLLDQVTERIQPGARALSFRVSDEIDGVVVSVIDSETDELIRQIPAESMVRLAEALQQLDASTGTAGLLLTEKA